MNLRKHTHAHTPADRPDHPLRVVQRVPLLVAIHAEQAALGKLRVEERLVGLESLPVVDDLPDRLPLLHPLDVIKVEADLEPLPHLALVWPVLFTVWVLAAKELPLVGVDVGLVRAPVLSAHERIVRFAIPVPLKRLLRPVHHPVRRGAGLVEAVAGRLLL